MLKLPGHRDRKMDGTKGHAINWKQILETATNIWLV